MGKKFILCDISLYKRQFYSFGRKKCVFLHFEIFGTVYGRGGGEQGLAAMPQNPQYCARFLTQKKAEEDATFFLIIDGTFFPRSMSNEPGTGLCVYIVIYRLESRL
jgi:hypothetical protein